MENDRRNVRTVKGRGRTQVPGSFLDIRMARKRIGAKLRDDGDKLRNQDVSFVRAGLGFAGHGGPRGAPRRRSRFLRDHGSGSAAESGDPRSELGTSHPVDSPGRGNRRRRPDVGASCPVGSRYAGGGVAGQTLLGRAPRSKARARLGATLLKRFSPPTRREDERGGHDIQD